MGKYSVSGVKTFMGMEGHGFNANLHEDGKKVAFVIDDANGGCYNWRWLDNSAKERLDAYLKADPKWSKETFEVADQFIGSLLDDYESDKKLKALCKRKTVVHVKSEADIDYHTFKLKYKPELKDKLIAACDKLFGVDNWECVNEKLSVW